MKSRMCVVWSSQSPPPPFSRGFLASHAERPQRVDWDGIWQSINTYHEVHSTVTGRAWTSNPSWVANDLSLENYRCHVKNKGKKWNMRSKESGWKKPVERT
ncbi:hypothetical protein FRC18_009338 [Serendipita sp. 400]|nr:hypothetical protein FRC18_009338 [Serendipita sp. 400]